MLSNLKIIGTSTALIAAMLSLPVLLAGLGLCDAQKSVSGNDDKANTVEVASNATGVLSKQPNTVSADYSQISASTTFEPLLLLLLGSTFLFIGAGIKLVLSRRLKRDPGLAANDK